MTRTLAVSNKSKFVASKTPSVTMAMDIQKNIIVPLQVLEKKHANPLISELIEIAQDLYKLALKKVAEKYEVFLNARKSFEPGLLNSEFKFAYLQVWLDMTSKRVTKIVAYKDRLEKIKERTEEFDKKLDALQRVDNELYNHLKSYLALVRAGINMTDEWLVTSNTLFTNELNKLKSREKAFNRAKGTFKAKGFFA
jgi:predicted transcriptional regulator